MRISDWSSDVFSSDLASIIVESATTRILVDTSPDLREQLLAADIIDIDAILWTHDHADHCHGIDDVRQIFHHRGKPVPGYARRSEEHTSELPSLMRISYAVFCLKKKKRST